MTVLLRNDTIAGVEAELGLMRTAKLAIDPTGPVMLRLAAGQRIALEFTAVPQGWGAHAVGPLVGVGLAAVLVALGSAARSSTPVHAGVALLGAMLLLRHDARLMLAPLYGAGLLLVDELATRSIELAGVTAIGPGVASTRAAAVLAVAAAGVRRRRRSDRRDRRTRTVGDAHGDRGNPDRDRVRSDRPPRPPQLPGCH